MKDSFNKTLPVNEEILTGILQSLSHESDNSIAQPHLVVGEMGSGKSYLLRELASEIGTNYPGLFPIGLIDGRTLFSTQDLWKYSIGINGRPVLLVDDIQYYFDRTSVESQFDLRGRLSVSGAPILIATSEYVPHHITDYSSALFDAFKVSYIKPVSKDIYIKFVDDESQLDRLNRLMDYLPKTISSLLMVREILKQSNNKADDIEKLRERYSGLYYGRYSALPIPMQRILSALVYEKEGLTLAGLREKTEQDNGKISPYLKIMVDNGILEKTALSQRGAVYRMADPLFRLWLSSSE